MVSTDQSRAAAAVPTATAWNDDLLRNPQLAKGDQIVAIPTLVRKLPPPLKQIIGDLSNRERVLVGLDMRPANSR